LLLSVALPLALAPGAVRAAEESLEAESLIRQGVELRAHGKDERALPLFEKAYKTSRTPRTAGQLGLVELSVGYFVEAERYLGEALASPDHPWVAKNLSMLKQQLDSAKDKIGELAVSGTPDGAEVLVNGKPVGSLPLLSPVRLDKGRAEVQLRAPGYLPARDTVTIAGRAREERSFALARDPTAPGFAPPAKPVPRPRATAQLQPESRTFPPVPVAPATRDAAPVPPATPDGADRSNPLRPWAWVAAGGAVGGLAFGGIEAFAASRKLDEFNHHTGLVDGLFARDCGTAALNMDCKSLKQSYDRALLLSIVGFAAGGALAATSIALFWASAPEPRQTTALRCVPSAMTPGVACGWRF
jgi:hypothetical protein